MRSVYDDVFLPATFRSFSIYMLLMVYCATATNNILEAFPVSPMVQGALPHLSTSGACSASHWQRWSQY